MKNKLDHFIIIGAGIAGISAIKGIREKNLSAKITLLTNEDRLPYKRTKINKSIAKGFVKDEFSLYTNNWYTEHNVQLIYQQVESIIPKNKTVKLDNGELLRYTKLLIATGASPFIPTIKGITSNDFLHVQNALMVENLINKTNTKQSFLIIGGGIEGLETANQLVMLNKKAIIIDQLDNPLKHLFPSHISKEIFNNLEKQGVNLLFGRSVYEIKKENGSFILDLGEHKYRANDIIACTGTRPNIKLAINAGLAVNKGILVDEFLKTSAHDIYAAGDVAEHNNGMITGLWHPAEKQGITAGKNMNGQKTAHQHIPFRLKTTLANHFYFTGNYKPGTDDYYSCLTESDGKIYREVYHKNSQIHAIIMVNDKSRSKIYQRAVFESWSMEQFHKELPLNT